MTITTRTIAEACHEANRVLRLAFGDSGDNPHWDEAGAEQQASATNGVEGALAGATPEQSHESWLAFKSEHGWTYGDVKDEDAKTHPCMVAYAELPADQRVKDDLFVGVVRSLAEHLA